MARKRSARKPKKRQNRGGASSRDLFSGKQALTVLLCLAVLAGAFYGIYYFFMNSNYFTIREIVINKDQDYSLRKGEKKLERIYLGRNIFTVDPRQVQMLVKNDHPRLKKVEVRRSFPGALEVDIVSREPVAVIESGGGIIIDPEGVVLAIGERSKGLVKIKGISFFLHMPSRGEKINNRALKKSLLLLEVLRKRMHAERKNIDYVDISDKNNIVVSIYGAAVKMGTDDFVRKIEELKSIVNDPNINMKDIKYIDLRFDDAVIAPR